MALIFLHRQSIITLHLAQSAWGGRMSERQSRLRDEQIVLAARSGWEGREHAQCAALVRQWARMVLLCDRVAPTAGDAGKLETPAPVPFPGQSTPAAEKPHFFHLFS